MSSEVEEPRPIDESRITDNDKDVKSSESTENVNFTKPAAVRTPGKFNLRKHKKLKLKGKLVRQNSKKRHEPTFKKKNENFKLKRKRLHHGKFCSYKRRKKERAVIIPPTKFLLGGNICDPLNLNS